MWGSYVNINYLDTKHMSYGSHTKVSFSQKVFFGICHTSEHQNFVDKTLALITVLRIYVCIRIAYQKQIQKYQQGIAFFCGAYNIYIFLYKKGLKYIGDLRYNGCIRAGVRQIIYIYLR